MFKKLLDNKVVKAGSWYAFTEVFNKGISFLTIPIFTRLLSTADYGYVSLYTTWVSVFTIIIGLDMNTSITKGKYDFKEDFDKYVSNVIFLSIIVFIGYMGILTLFGKQVQSITGLSGWIFYFMLFQSYFNFVKTSLITKFRVEYNYKKISLISILINLLGVFGSIGLVIFVFPERAYLGMILGNGSPLVLFGLLFLWYLLKIGRGNYINVNHWKYALTFSAPLIISSLASLINAQFDRIVINRYIGEAATGLYSFAYNIGMIITVLTYALDQAWTPWVYEQMEAENFKEIRSKAKFYRNFYTVVYAGLLFVSPELIKIMADKTYWEALVIIPYIFAGYYFSYMYTLEMKTEFYYRKTFLLSLGTVSSSVINIILNLIFVPQYGYIAAAITTTVSYMFLFIFHYLITSKILKKSIYGMKFHFCSLVYMTAITIYFITFMDNVLMRIFGVIIVLGMGYWFMIKKTTK